MYPASTIVGKENIISNHIRFIVRCPLLRVGLDSCLHSCILEVAICRKMEFFEIKFSVSINVNCVFLQDYTDLQPQALLKIKSEGE